MFGIDHIVSDFDEVFDRWDSLILPHSKSDEVELKNFILVNGLSSVYKHMRVFLGAYWPIEIVDSMDRWIEINYTVDAADTCGAFGTRLKVSDALRWLADEKSESSEYYIELTNRLDVGPMPAKPVGDPWLARRQLLLEYACLVSLMDEDLSPWSADTLSRVHCLARAAIEGDSLGTSMQPHLIPFPTDFLPPGQKLTRDGYGGQTLTTHWLLRNALERSELSSQERLQIRIAKLFYPSPDLEFDFKSGTGDMVRVDSLLVSRHHCEHDFGPVIGSVQLDHYGSDSKVSIDPGEYDFRLHQAAMPLRDDDELYYLVSELVTYIGFAG